MGRPKGGKVSGHIYDTPEQIERCLTCPLPDCGSYCPYRRKPHVKRGGRKSLLDRDGVGRELVLSGMSDKAIGEKLGLTDNTVYAWRKRNGLKAGRFQKKRGEEA